MPLSKLIGAFTDGLRAFLADDSCIALELDVSRELEAQAAKLLQSVAAEHNDLLVPAEVHWLNGESEICATIALELASAVMQAREVFGDGERLRFNLPTHLEPASERCPGEIRLVEYAETIHRALSHHVRRVAIVLALRIEAGQEAECAAFLRRMMTVTGTADLKWIFFTSQRLGLEPELTRLRLGPHVIDERGFGASLERLMREPARRVSVARQASMLAGVRKHHHLVGPDFLAVMVDDISYGTRGFYFTEAARSLSHQCLEIERRGSGGRHVRPLFDEAHELAGYHEAEIHFADFSERLCKAMLKEHENLLIVMAPNPKTQAEGLDASVEVLARSAASTRVRYVVLDARLSDQFDRKFVWTVAQLRYALDPEAIERQMAERLDSPEASSVERVRALGALASTSLAKGDPETALTHSLAALELSRECDAPAETTAAWYGLGSTLYQCAAFEPAERAYAECADRAVDEASDAMAALAMAGIGHTYFMRKLSDQAMEFYVTARKLWKKQRNRDGEVYALSWHGEAAAQRGDFPSALARLDEAIALCDGELGQADANQAARAELLQRKANVHAKADQSQEEKTCRSEAERLGATAPVGDHP